MEFFFSLKIPPTILDISEISMEKIPRVEKRSSVLRKANR